MPGVMPPGDDVVDTDGDRGSHTPTMAPSDAVGSSVATGSDASAASSFLWLVILIMLLLLLLLFFVVHRHLRQKEEESPKPKHRQQISMRTHSTNMLDNPMYVMTAVTIGEAIVEEKDGAGNVGTTGNVAYEDADNDPREETQHGGGGGGEHMYDTVEVSDPAMAPGVEYATCDDSQFSQHTGAGSLSSSPGPATGAVALVRTSNPLYLSGDVGSSSTSSSVAVFAVATADKMNMSSSTTDGVNLVVQDGEVGVPVFSATVVVVSGNDQYTDVAPSPASQYRDVAPSPSIGAMGNDASADSMYTDVAPDAESSPLAASVPRLSNGYVRLIGLLVPLFIYRSAHECRFSECPQYFHLNLNII